jgi:flagellar protein FlaI
MTRNIFTWSPFDDQHKFNGLYNSFVLEEKLAPKLGLADRRDIYKELDRRRLFLDELVRRNVFRQSEIAKRLRERRETYVPIIRSAQ